MVLRHFDDLLARAKRETPVRVAVARAEEPSVLEGLALAHEAGLVVPLLYGDQTKIKACLAELGIAAPWEIRHLDADDRGVANAAALAVGSGEAQVLMKGMMHTGALFGAVLARENGLRKSAVLSHLMLVEVAGYPKLFGTTDGGLIVAPTFEQKTGILRNTIETLRALGYEEPKIGLLSYVEKAREDDPETWDWHTLSEMARAGEFGRVLVDGPLAADLCFSKESKAKKGSQSPVAADVDAVVTPNITVCNAMTKALVAFAGAQIAGVVVGAKAPVVVVSRADSPRARYLSIAMACALLPHTEISA